RRSPWPLLGALGGLAVLGGAVVLLATRGGPPEPSPAQPPEAAEPPAAATTTTTTAQTTAQPEKDVPVEPPPPPPPAPEKLAIRSRPEGASVFRGHERLGQTPLSLERPAAATDLRFELDGHEPQVRRVTPEEAQVDVTLVKRHGKRQSR